MEYIFCREVCPAVRVITRSQSWIIKRVPKSDGLTMLMICWSINMYHLNVDMTLTHWGWETHICVGNLTIIGPDNGLSPGRRQAIIWTNAGILLIGPLGTNFSEILIEIYTFSFKKMRFKLSSGKWRTFCLGLNVLTLDAWMIYR